MLTRQYGDECDVTDDYPDHQSRIETWRTVCSLTTLRLKIDDDHGDDDVPPALGPY